MLIVKEENKTVNICRQLDFDREVCVHRQVNKIQHSDCLEEVLPNV